MISPEKSTDKLFQVAVESPAFANSTSLNNSDSSEIKVYAKRWSVLAIFSLVTLINAFNWIEYNIIQDVTIAFYNESLPYGIAEQNDAVNWLSMIYMLCYVPLVFPAMFLLDRKGLKLSILLGALLTTIGTYNDSTKIILKYLISMILVKESSLISL